MGRAERRQRDRKHRIETRKGKFLLSHQELNDIIEYERLDMRKYTVESLMSCFALAEYRLYDADEDKIRELITFIDGLMEDILDEKATMDQYLDELEEGAGVIIIDRSMEGYDTVDQQAY